MKEVAKSTGQEVEGDEVEEVDSVSPKTHQNIGLQKKWSKGKLFRIKFWTRWFLSIFLSEQYFDFKSRDELFVE